MSGGQTTTRGSSPACSAIGKGVSAAVLDTAALLASVQLHLPLTCVTTEEVYDEVRDEESRAALDLSAGAGKLLVITPSAESRSKALEYARAAGVLGKLSAADLSVLSLAIELRDCGNRVSVVTDDYALQLASVHAGLDVVRVRYRGIKELRKGKANLR